MHKIQEQLNQLKIENSSNDEKNRDFQMANSLAFRAVLNISQTELPNRQKYFNDLAEVADDLKQSIKNDQLTHENASYVIKQLHQAIKENEVDYQYDHE